jgi:hypothetical protein
MRNDLKVILLGGILPALENGGLSEVRRSRALHRSRFYPRPREDSRARKDARRDIFVLV